MSQKNLFIIGVFAVICDIPGKILLCHRTDMDLWNLPGGAMEVGETPWDAAMREVEEEVGLKVKVERLLGVYSRPDQNEVALGFICKVVGGNLKYTNEADRIEYFSPDKLPTNTNHEQLEAIQDFAQQHVQAKLRLQAGLSPRDIYFGKL